MKNLWLISVVDKKADYKDLVIVQRALLITGNTREEVAMTVRKETEIQSGQAVPRITSGPTILFSHSPDEDPQAILDANFEHDGIDVSGQDSLELVAVNDVKGGYVFLVRVCRVHLHKILSGKDPDKEFQISGRRMALVALINSGKNMEKNLLNSATNINNQLESL